MIQQLKKQSIYSMPIGTLFTFTKTGYEPDRATLCIYRKHKRSKCIELLTNQEFSIPRRFNSFLPFGYPLEIDYIKLLELLSKEI